MWCRRPAVIATALVVALCCAPASAQDAGWHYSPLPGEGDRAALGCARGSDAATFACVAVRCEDDYDVGLHLFTSQPTGDAGDWRITVDEEFFDLRAVADGSPYGGRVEGDIGPVLDALKNGAVAYLTPSGRAELPLNAIPLTGSLYAINQALYFCAPRTMPDQPETATDALPRSS
jgi:hypothetical protein